MLINHSISARIIGRKIATTIMLAFFTAGAFATLGDGKGKSKNKSLLSKQQLSIVPGTFTLKTGYNYRGSQVINQEKEDEFILLNTTITYQKGRTIYILPLKRKVLLDKVKLNPAKVAIY